VRHANGRFSSVPAQRRAGICRAGGQGRRLMVSRTLRRRELCHIERRINLTHRTHVPRDRVAGIERELRTGDLVAITTSISGLDYAHTGLIVRQGSGARLLHASSRAVA
jgi:hypothetical protein